MYITHNLRLLYMYIYKVGVRVITRAITVALSKDVAGPPGVRSVQSFLDRTTTKRLGLRGTNSDCEALQRAPRSMARLLERERKSLCVEGYTDTPWENSLPAEASS
jgi:hypothetical protein